MCTCCLCVSFSKEHLLLNGNFRDNKCKRGIAIGLNMTLASYPDDSAELTLSRGTVRGCLFESVAKSVY